MEEEELREVLKGKMEKMKRVKVVSYVVLTEKQEEEDK